MEIISIINNSGPLIIGALLGVIIGMIPIIKDAAENNWKKQFRKQVRLGIIKDHLTYEDMQHIAERWYQDRKTILLSLRIMHSEAISGGDEELSKQLQCIRDLLTLHQKKEPYAELPENISIQLDAISGSSAELENQVTQLASSLSELYISNQQGHSRQVKFTYWGAISGLVGILVGVAGLYFAVIGNA